MPVRQRDSPEQEIVRGVPLHVAVEVAHVESAVLLGKPINSSDPLSARAATSVAGPGTPDKRALP